MMKVVTSRRSSGWVQI